MKMTKLKIINWMYFTNTTIELKGNSLITGRNGTGKSTIIDAIQYLLLGSKGKSKFNVAAGDASERTLESYVRGYVNNGNIKYLRENNTVTHLAMEVEKNGIYYIFGVCIEYTLGSLNERFYYVENAKLEDHMYVHNQYVSNYETLQNKFKEANKKMLYASSIAKYNQFQKTILGIDIEKYGKLLPKAIGFKSIQRVDEFIINFLLEDNPIDLEKIAEYIVSLDKLIKEIEHERTKMKDLEVIVEQGTRALNLDTDKRVLEIADLFSQINKYKKDILDGEKYVSLCKNSIVSNKAKEEEAKSNIETQKTIIAQVKDKIDSNESYRQLNALSEKLHLRKSELKEQSEYFNKFKSYIKDEKEIIAVSRNINKTVFKEINTYLEAQEFDNQMLLIKAFSDYTIEKEGLKETINAQLIALDGEKNNLTNEINQVKQTISNLEKGLKPYEGNTLRLISLLKEKLSEIYRKDIEVKPIAEYVEVLDEKWRNALEGYLNTQKFNLVVEPAYFKNSLSIYQRYKAERHIEGVGIIDSTKYIKTIEKTEGSLSNFIRVSNENARKYLYQILNKVICVDEVDELNKYEVSITSDCMRYQNNVAGQIKKSSYETPYLGAEANRIALQSNKERLTQLEDLLEKNSKEIELKRKWLEVLKKSISEQMVAESPFIQSVDKFKHLSEQVSQLEKMKAEMEKDKTYIELNMELEWLNKTLNKFTEELINASANIKASDIEIDKFTQLIGSYGRHKEDLEVTYFKHPKQLIVLAETQYKKYNKEPEEAKKLIFAQKNKVERELNVVARGCLELMIKFNAQYSCGLEAEYLNTQEYQKIYVEIKDKKLFEFDDKKTDLQEKIKETYITNYGANLRSRINDGIQQVKRLNDLLKDKVFGYDRYQIVYGTSKDPEYKMMYDIVMNGDFEVDLFNNSRNTEFLKNKIDEFINSDNKKMKQDFIDYRKYLYFDVKVITPEGEKLLSEVKYTQSGGEVQVPFYIIAATSFEQLRDRRVNDSLCIALFDEAFNNMDSQRVSEMLKFYKSLNIQIILSLSEKYEVIAPYMETILAVIKNGNLADVGEFSKDELE